MKLNAPKIEAHKITKPIQLTAVWFVALVLIEGVFLAAACKISDPAWIAPALVIAGIAFIPIFLVAILLLQTTFRTHLQEDRYYSAWLERQEKMFGGFVPENVASKQGQVVPSRNDPLENLRIQRYQRNQGMFLVHTWRPSKIPGQVADIIISLHQHEEGPLTTNKVARVEYELGPKFFRVPQVKKNAGQKFKLEVSAWGPMLCLARVFLKGSSDPIVLERYINFDTAFG